jgi:hypothetical protein
MVEVSQQVVRQIDKQDETRLGQETLLAPCCQAQAALVIAELLNLSPSTGIVSDPEKAFGGQRKGRNK